MYGTLAALKLSLDAARANGLLRYRDVNGPRRLPILPAILEILP